MHMKMVLTHTVKERNVTLMYLIEVCTLTLRLAGSVWDGIKRRRIEKNNKKDEL